MRFQGARQAPRMPRDFLQPARNVALERSSDCRGRECYCLVGKIREYSLGQFLRQVSRLHLSAKTQAAQPSCLLPIFRGTDPKWSAGIDWVRLLDSRQNMTELEWALSRHPFRNQDDQPESQRGLQSERWLSFGFGVNWQRIDAGPDQGQSTYAAFGAPAGTGGSNILRVVTAPWGINLGACSMSTRIHGLVWPIAPR